MNSQKTLIMKISKKQSRPIRKREYLRTRIKKETKTGRNRTERITKT